jgi:hypothetical protein
MTRKEALEIARALATVRPARGGLVRTAMRLQWTKTVEQLSLTDAIWHASPSGEFRKVAKS